MDEPEPISDQEFLNQLVDRLKASGHRLVFVDRGLIQFSKVVAAFLGLFLLISITFFGLDLKQAADELAETRTEIEEKRGQLNSILSEVKITAEGVRHSKVQMDDQIANFKERMAETEKLAAEAENQAYDGFSRSLISMTGVVAEMVSVQTHTLRDFYLTNLDFAERKGLHLLRIEFLGRLAELEWFDGNRLRSRSLFDQAINIALGLKDQRIADNTLKRIAGETLVRKGEFERSLYPEARQVALAKAKGLFSRALGLFKASDDPAGQAYASRRIAETHRLGGNQQEALSFFEQSRQLYLSFDSNEDEMMPVVSALAEIYRDLGNTEEAVNYYSESVSIAEGLKAYDSASEFAFQLAKLQEAGPVRLTYLCTATKLFNQYFDQAPPPSRKERFELKLQRIDDSFDPEAVCKERGG